MDVIIMGLGAVGKVLTEALSAKGLNVTVIDKDEKKVEDAINLFDVRGVVGNGISHSVLQEAEVAKAEILITTTSQDELNILCCIVAKRLGAKTTIARVAETEYSKLASEEDSLGVSLMVNPQYETAMEISRVLRFPSAIKVDQFAGGKVELVEYKVPCESPLIGVQLKDRDLLFKSRVLICAATHDGNTLIPNGDYAIAEGDHIFVTATAKDVDGFFKELGESRKSRRVIVVGGSRTAIYLCEELVRKGVSVKLIEQDKQKCQQLCSQLKKVEVILGDGTDQQLLKEEGIEDADAFIALGNIDEQNIIVSMFAKSVGVPRVVTKVDQMDYINMLKTSGIDSVVSTKTSTADQILRFVRNFRNKDGAVVKGLATIVDEKAEALEFTASSAFRKFGVPISELHIKKNILIACIVRDGEVITPSGKDCILENDSVVVITLIEGLKTLNDILELF